VRPHPQREAAKDLRRQGYSYKEIQQKLGIGKSTLHYILKDIVLTKAQQERLQQKIRDGAKTTTGGKETWKRHPEQLLKNLIAGRANKTGVSKRTRFSQYISGVKTESAGKYRFVIIHGHPMADKRGRILEHRYVMAQQLGRLLLNSEIVHHKDENKLNNHPDNLELLSGDAEHKRLHHPDAWVIIKCVFCEKEFTRSRRYVGRGKNDFCSHSCSSLFYRGCNKMGTAKSGTSALHGTNTMYHLKCRCLDCKAAHAAYTKEYRRRKKAQTDQ
jgi:hypothetical protein